MKNEYQILLDEVRQNFVSVVWSHKTQEKQADIYRFWYAMIECANIVCSAVATSGILAVLFCNQKTEWLEIITSIISFGSLVFAAFLKSFDLKEKELINKNHANRLVVIRNKLVHVIAEIHMKKRSVDEINTDYECILSELNDLYVNAPATTSKALSKADEALNVCKDFTYSVEEIDKFLPPHLRGNVED